jgi:hypothetical protein
MKKTYVLAAAAGAALVLVAWFSRDPASGQEKPAPAAAKWEYKVVTKLTALGPPEEAELNRLGDEGWELTAAAGTASKGERLPAVSFIFKRPKR